MFTNTNPMEPNTMTRIGDLQPGDIFTRPGCDTKFMKIAATTVVKHKHKYRFAAMQLGRDRPRLFQQNIEVEYLFTSLSVT